MINEEIPCFRNIYLEFPIRLTALHPILISCREWGYFQRR